MGLAPSPLVACKPSGGRIRTVAPEVVPSPTSFQLRWLMRERQFMWLVIRTCLLNLAINWLIDSARANITDSCKPNHFQPTGVIFV